MDLYSLYFLIGWLYWSPDSRADVCPFREVQTLLSLSCFIYSNSLHLKVRVSCQWFYFIKTCFRFKIWCILSKKSFFIVCPVMFLFPRKKTMLLNNVFLISSSLLALLSRTAKSVEMIIISRFLVGINAGTVYIYFICKCDYQ